MREYNMNTKEENDLNNFKIAKEQYDLRVKEQADEASKAWQYKFNDLYLEGYCEPQIAAMSGRDRYKTALTYQIMKKLNDPEIDVTSWRAFQEALEIVNNIIPLTDEQITTGNG